MCNIRNEDHPYYFQYTISGSQHLIRTEGSYISNNLYEIVRNKMHIAYVKQGFIRMLNE